MHAPKGRGCIDYPACRNESILAKPSVVEYVKRPQFRAIVAAVFPDSLVFHRRSNGFQQIQLPVLEQFSHYREQSSVKPEACEDQDRLEDQSDGEGLGGWNRGMQSPF